MTDDGQSSLRAKREWHPDRRAAQKRDEAAPFHIPSPRSGKIIAVGSQPTKKLALSLVVPAPYIWWDQAFCDAAMKIDEIIENFELLDEWDDRYRYLIELGRTLPQLPEAARTEANKVRGCASQVWVQTHVNPDGAAGPVLEFDGDSDAHIVRGLIAVLFALYSGQPAKEIVSTDAQALFERLGLREHLTPQRSNGFRSMVDRIQSDARRAMTA